MISQTDREERYIRFYHWAMGDAEREVRQDYPLLRTLQDTAVMAYLKFVEGLSEADRLQLAAVLVRWSLQDALPLIGDVRTAAEDEIRRSYLSESGRYRSVADRALNEPRGTPLQRRRLAALVKQKLGPVVRASVTQQEAYDHDLVAVTPVGPWFVGTRVQILRSRGAMRYWQCIMAYETELIGPQADCLQIRTNISSWMGIGRTEWEIPFADDMEAASESLAWVCRHFLREMPRVLHGLTPGPRAPFMPDQPSGAKRS